MQFSQAYPGTAAVLVDEFDAGLFERLLHYDQRCTTRFAYPGFYLSNGHNTDPGMIGEVLLAPINESASCPTLCWGDHRGNMPIKCDSINSVEKRLTYLLYRL